MLPNIVNVAEENGLILNPRTVHKREVFAKCPFCLGDANVSNKYKLSLNSEKNVYKCWLCKVSGGVLDLESRLTGKSFEEVREKYFGQSKRKRHYAENLTPIQLKKIGWHEFKRANYNDFLKKRDAILHDWNAYCFEEKKKHFALFMVAAHIDDPKRMNSLLEYIQNSCSETGIYLLFSNLVEQYILDFEKREEWAKQGTEIARFAWKCSISVGDKSMQGVTKYVLFSYYLSKMNSKERLRYVQ